MERIKIGTININGGRDYALYKLIQNEYVIFFFFFFCKKPIAIYVMTQKGKCGERVKSWL